MSTVSEAVTRLREFRQSFEDGLIDEESCLTTADVDAVLNAIEGTPALRQFDDDTLLDMYDHAHETSDEHCDAIAAELIWRGIEVTPCGHQHAA